MSDPHAASEVLDREFLEIRAKLLELSASFDRLNRAGGDVDEDPRMQAVRHALEVLHSKQPDRAEQVQLIFSLPYEGDWKEAFGLAR